MDEYVQGGSIDRTVNLNDGTNPIDTDDFSTIEVIAANTHSGETAGPYSIALANLTKLDPKSEGNVFFDIPPAVSLLMSPGLWDLQVTTTETDADYDSNERTRRYKGPSFILHKSV